MKWGTLAIAAGGLVLLWTRPAGAGGPPDEPDEPDEGQGDEPEEPMPSTIPNTPHFAAREFQSPDGVDVPRSLWGNLARLMDALEVIRSALGNKPITITPAGGYRTKAVNESNPGRAKRSQHLHARAADIRVAGMNPQDVAAVIYQLQDEGQIPMGGLKAYPQFTHVDIRGFRPKGWGYAP